MDISKKISSIILFNNRLERIWKIAQIDFKKRYYNSVLGLVWAFINPLLQSAIFYYVLTFVFRVTREENYALVLLSGMILWQIFSETSIKGIRLLVQKRYLFENMQFKNLDLYIASVLSVFFGFVFNLIAFQLIAYFVGIRVNVNYLYLPLVLINLYILCMGTAMILSVLFIYFKDIQQVWSIILMFGFWTAGILGRGRVFLEAMPALIYINPMLPIVMNFRGVIMYDQPIDWGVLAISYAQGLVAFGFGYWLLKNFSHKAIEKI